MWQASELNRHFARSEQVAGRERAGFFSAVAVVAALLSLQHGSLLSRDGGNRRHPAFSRSPWREISGRLMMQRERKQASSKKDSNFSSSANGTGSPRPLKQIGRGTWRPGPSLIVQKFLHKSQRKLTKLSLSAKPLQECAKRESFYKSIHGTTTYGSAVLHAYELSMQLQLGVMMAHARPCLLFIAVRSERDPEQTGEHGEREGDRARNSAEGMHQQRQRGRDQ